MSDLLKDLIGMNLCEACGKSFAGEVQLTQASYISSTQQSQLNVMNAASYYPALMVAGPIDPKIRPEVRRWRGSRYDDKITDSSGQRFGK